MQKKLTELAAIATLNDADVLHIVDTSDTTSDPAGTSFKVTVAQLKAIFKPVVIALDVSIDGITATFPVASQPKWIVLNGSTYFEGGGYTYTPGFITIDFVPEVGMKLAAII